MSDGSSIEYLSAGGVKGASWSPLGWGCFGPNGTKEKPGRCPYCFAKRQADRHLRGCPECQAFVPHFHEDMLDQLAHWKQPRRIFVQSMGDLFGVGVDGKLINRVWMEMFNNQRHCYLLLTKRPDRMASWTKWAARGKGWPEEDIWSDWCWLGTSVTNQQDANIRLGQLCAIPSVRRWISVEPLHGPVDIGFWLRPYPQVRYIAIGSETGNRPGKIIPERAWIESIVEQCKAAFVPVFVKDNVRELYPGEWPQELPPEMSR